MSFYLCMACENPAKCAGDQACTKGNNPDQRGEDRVRKPTWNGTVPALMQLTDNAAHRVILADIQADISDVLAAVFEGGWASNDPKDKGPTLRDAAAQIRAFWRFREGVWDDPRLEHLTPPNAAELQAYRVKLAKQACICKPRHVETCPLHDASRK